MAHGDSDRTIIYVFLASPSDLAEERTVVRATVDSVNRAVARTLGIQLELLGWEDVLPGASRPQELINDDVDRCQLFVGMLHKRWGTPTGTHSSGFEEEFERAKSRHRGTGQPEIWLLLKEIPDADRIDVGPQLQRVLDFRSQITASRSLLYKEFGAVTDLQSLLGEFLIRHVLERSQSNTATEGRLEPARAGAVDIAELEVPPSQGYGSAGAQVIGNLDFWRTQLSRPVLMASRGEDRAAARLALFAFATLTARGEFSFNAPREAMLIYRHRLAIELTEAETRMMLAATMRPGSLIPWYWLRGLSLEALGDAYKSALALPANSVLRLGAARRLLEIGVLSGEETNDLALALLARPAVRRLPGSVTNAIAQATTEQLVRVAEIQSALGPTSDPMSPVSHELAVRHARDNPEAAAQSLLLDPVADAQAVVRALRSGTGPVSEGTLVQLAGSESIWRRRAAAVALATGPPDDAGVEALLGALLKDSDVGVRREALDSLNRRGATIDLATIEASFPPGSGENLLELMSIQLALKHDAAELGAMVGITGVGPAAYAALMRLPGAATQARSDLGSAMDRFLPGATSLRAPDGVHRGLARRLLRPLLVSALSALERDPALDDAILAREILGGVESPSELCDQAAALLASVSDQQSDIDLILGGTDTDAYVRPALRRAISRLVQRLGIIELGTEAVELPDDFVLHVARSKPSDPEAFLLGCIQSENPRVRAGAAMLLCRTLSDSDLERRLDAYVEIDGAPPDVAKRFDEELYFRRRVVGEARPAGPAEA